MKMRVLTFVASVTVALLAAFATFQSVQAQCSCSSCSESEYSGVPDFQPTRNYGDSTVTFAPSSYRQDAYGSMPNTQQFVSQNQMMPSFAPEQYPTQLYQGAPFPGQPYPTQPYQSDQGYGHQPGGYETGGYETAGCETGGCDAGCGEQLDPGYADYFDCEPVNENDLCTFGMFGGWNQGFETDSGDLFGGGTDREFNNGYFAGLSIGKRFASRSRMDFEFGYRTDETDYTSDPLTDPAFLPFEGEVKIYTAMANFYLDFSNRTRFTPYVGTGIGYAYLAADSQFTGSDFEFDNNSTLAFQAMAGLSTRVCRNLKVYAEYRYFSTEDLILVSNNPLAPAFEGPYRAHNVIGGLRFEY